MKYRKCMIYLNLTKIMKSNVLTELQEGDELRMGEALWSPAENYYIKIEDNGDLTMKEKDGKRIWHSNTANKGQSPYSLRMQSDHNLVLYAGSGGDKKAIWASGSHVLISCTHMGTCWNDEAIAYLTDGGNFVIESGQHTIWAILQVGEFKIDWKTDGMILSRVP